MGQAAPGCAGFDPGDNLRSAVTHPIQTIGDAARRVSPDFEQAHPNIPWRQIVGMRRKVVHDYLHIDLPHRKGRGHRSCAPLVDQPERIVPGQPPQSL
ncbi:MAG TPA: DUF86 domain-containing protein [Planctomycetaceae bacterium]|nr:DUF86 domain-containing protein [Planctomycetaceae bacterium]HIQ20800.1 DUF86 domain-containing protein [Planctomycetota bacterium]